MIKHATRKPESREENARNRKPANPSAMEMYDCTQNAFSDVHVSVSLRFRASDVPAAFADSTRNEKPCKTTVPSNSQSLYVDRQITHQVGFDRRTGSLEILKHLNQTGRTLTRESLETVLARNSNRTHIPSWTQDSRRIRHDANRKSYRTIPAVRCETPKSTASNK